MDKTENLSNIANAIKKIDSTDLFESSINLFNTLGYNTTRQSRLDKPTFTEFEQNFLTQNDNITNLAKFKEKAQTTHWQTIELLFQLTDREMSHQADMFDTGNFDNTEIYSYLFMAIELKAQNYTRTTISDITRQVNHIFSMPVMLLFKNGDNVTLSIIKRRLNKKDASRDVLEKVTLIKDINIKNPHRAHIDILFDLSLEELRQEYSVTNFTELQQAWQKTLDLKKLNERFYQEVSTWYYYALNKIKLPIKPEFYKDDKENVKHFAVRLISRLLFSWFLKEMGLIDKQLLEIEIAKADLLFKEQYNKKDFLEKNSYYRYILQNIFFASLNTQPKERKNFYYEKKLSIDSDIFKKIPYLNGGLFEKLEEDNCNDRIDDCKIKIPNELFYAEEIKVKVDKKEKKTKGINKIFEQYKFTVDENTSFEEEVALDPELLGLIFENLLAEIDPNDTISKSARKATGSFYTPRKIIDYMVNESLLLYFTNFLKKYDFDTRELKTLVYYEKSTDNIKFRQLIVQAIDEIKVLDPACGSGAFPMGVLHKLVRILNVVDKNNHLWIEKQLHRLPIELREQTKQELIRHEINYARKLGIIRNSIYSVDIQPMAIMISKLRFFISLLIEQDIDLKDTKHNYHISPLPNLETKIICANTLKDTDIQRDIFTEQTIATLIEAKDEYYQNNNLTNSQKNDLLATIVESLHAVYPDFAQEITGKKIIDNASKELLNRKYLEEWFKHGNLSAPFFDMDIFYPELKGSGFDIVIGNPPYGGEKIPDEVKKHLGLGSKDPYGAFIARFLGNGYSAKLSEGRATPLKIDGILSYIVSDTFMTIKSHLQLRTQMMKNKIHKMIRVHPDTFKATVNTAIILCEKKAAENITAQSIEASHKCTMADLTTVSIHDNHDRFVELLYHTTETEITPDIATEGDKQPVLKMQGDDWTSESSTEYAIYTYPQNLININSNLPFFVASPKLFVFQKTKHGKGFVQFGDEYSGMGKSKKWLNIGLFKVVSGIKTGSNKKYLRIIGDAQKSFTKISEDYLLSNKDAEALPKEDKLNGIKDKKCFVRFEMGMPSDTQTGVLPCYYQSPSNIVIDWSDTAVKAMKNEKHSDLANEEFRFQPLGNQISFSFAGQYCPTFRVASGPIFLNASSRILINKNSPIYYWLGFLNSKLSKLFMRNYINHTINFGIDDLKSLIVKDTSNIKIEKLVKNVINIQKSNIDYNFADNKQIEIDRLVYEAYGLNEDDITEVENWYARRYPNLKQTKKAGLKYDVIEKLKKRKTIFPTKRLNPCLKKKK